MKYMFLVPLLMSGCLCAFSAPPELSPNSDPVYVVQQCLGCDSGEGCICCDCRCDCCLTTGGCVSEQPVQCLGCEKFGECVCRNCMCDCCVDNKCGDPPLSTKDKLLSTGRFPRVLAFGIEDGDAVCVKLRLLDTKNPYTCGYGEGNLIQVLPADPDLMREFGVTEIPTFVRVIRGKMTHLHRGQATWKEVVNCVHGKQCFPHATPSPPQDPGFNPFYQITQPVHQFYQPVCTTGH